MCFFKLLRCLNDLLHLLHEYGFSPVCRSPWTFRLSRPVKPRLHISHLCGRSPECNVKCLLKFHLLYEEYEQILHLRSLRATLFPSVLFFGGKSLATMKSFWELSHRCPENDNFNSFGAVKTKENLYCYLCMGFF